MDKPVCVVIGAGAGIGGSVGARFAQEGYHAHLLRRSDQEGLDRLTSQIIKEGGSASGALLDAAKPDDLENELERVEVEIGPIDSLVYNLGAQIGNVPLPATRQKAFELCWRLGTLGLFRAAQTVIPHIEKRGKGSILVTSSTAAVRGNRGQHAHAAAMGGRRMLCQSLSAEYSSKGIHVCHIIIDGAVDAPDTLGKMFGAERFAQYKEMKGEHGMIDPAQVAETYFQLSQQPRSTWTHELDIRAFSDVAWWNTQ